MSTKQDSGNLTPEDLLRLSDAFRAASGVMRRMEGDRPTLDSYKEKVVPLAELLDLLAVWAPEIRRRRPNLWAKADALRTVLGQGYQRLDPSTWQRLSHELDMIAGEWAAAGHSASAPAPPTEEPIGDDAYLSVADIASRAGFAHDKHAVDALGKRLERWRRTHDDGWIETTDDRKSRDPKFLYRYQAVRHIVDAKASA